MPQYRDHIQRILRAAGISPESQLATELSKVLSERAQDWADRAFALGGDLDPGAATALAARGVATDPELRQRLEELEVEAVETFLNILGSNDGDAQPANAARSPSGARRRWGEGGQPQGSLTRDPQTDVEHTYAAPTERVVAVAQLIDLPVYGADRNTIGLVKSVMLAIDGDEPRGLMLATLR